MKRALCAVIAWVILAIGLVGCAPRSDPPPGLSENALPGDSSAEVNTPGTPPTESEEVQPPKPPETSEQNAGHAEPEETEADYERFLEIMSENGFRYIEEGLDDEHNFFSVERRYILIDDEIISVYEYASEEEMEKDAGGVSKDGFAINTEGGSAMVEWVSIPHFFKKDRIIVRYVGTNEPILELLREHYGEEFAGNGMY